MKIDFSQPINNITGDPFKNNNEVVTLKVVCVESLMSPRISEGKAGKEKMALWSLAKRVHDAAEPIDISAEDLAKLVDVVGQNYPAAVVGPACELLQK